MLYDVNRFKVYILNWFFSAILFLPNKSENGRRAFDAFVEQKVIYFRYDRLIHSPFHSYVVISSSFDRTHKIHVSQYIIFYATQNHDPGPRINKIKSTVSKELVKLGCSLQDQNLKLRVLNDGRQFRSDLRSFIACNILLARVIQISPKVKDYSAS